jgi:thiol-disulfide isomerase/thioredoxin
MRHSSRLAWMFAALTLIYANVSAQEPLAWETNLERGQQTAAQTNRLVLAHFWSPSCSPCKRMDAEVFSQPEVARQVQANYVPVKINADQNPEIAQRMGVDRLPTDVVLTPQGQIVNVGRGRADAALFIGRLNQWSAAYRQQTAGMLASLPTGPQGTAGNPPPVNQPNQAVVPAPDLSNPALQPAGNALPNGPSLALNGPANGLDAPSGNPMLHGNVPNNFPVMNNAFPQNNQPQPNVSSIVDNALARQPNAPQGNVPPNLPPNIPAPNGSSPVIPPTNNVASLSSGSPPMGLDGYCPVSLVEKGQWIRGDKRWGAYHQGRTYLFAGPEEQSRFLKNFNRYAPVASGVDIVLVNDEHRTVPGMREHGVFFADRIFLFAGEASLQKFSANPNFYVSQVLMAPRQAYTGGQQPR